jgi:2-dehydro-3-deoxyphosphogluconate aldolase/(4S)-4-hydroxy-2-oxoglutarate aldolase
MTDKNTIIESIKKQGLLPLYFNPDEATSINVLRALYSAGIRAVEYTNRGEEALANFKAMVNIRDNEMSDLYLGIGTLKNLADAEKYVAAGADYLISPGFVPEIAVFVKETGMLYAPGCMTPTEIIAAETSGVTFIKLFPGNALNPEYLSSIRSVFPKLLFMPTGGVEPTAESISAWFEAGVCAVGMGSKLVTNDLMKQNGFKTIEDNTKKILNIIKSLRS